MQSAAFAGTEGRREGAQERHESAEVAMPNGDVQTSPTSTLEREEEAAPAEQLQAPLAPPDQSKAAEDTVSDLVAESVTPSKEQEAAAGAAEEEETMPSSPKDREEQVEPATGQLLSSSSPHPPPPPSSGGGGSHHRVRPHLDVAAIAMIITSGSSAEAKTAQRVVNRSGQKALQQNFAEIFETVTAS